MDAVIVDRACYAERLRSQLRDAVPGDTMLHLVSLCVVEARPAPTNPHAQALREGALQCAVVLADAEPYGVDLHARNAIGDTPSDLLRGAVGDRVGAWRAAHRVKRQAEERQGASAAMARVLDIETGTGREAALAGVAAERKRMDTAVRLCSIMRQRCTEEIESIDALNASLWKQRLEGPPVPDDVTAHLASRDRRVVTLTEVAAMQALLEKALGARRARTWLGSPHKTGAG